MNNNGKITLHNYTDFTWNDNIQLEYSYPYRVDTSQLTVKHYGEPVAEPSPYVSTSINIGSYNHQLYMMHLFINSDIGNKLDVKIRAMITPPRVISSSSTEISYDKFNDNLLCVNPDTYYMCIGAFKSITNIILETTYRGTITVPSGSIVLRVQRL